MINKNVEPSILYDQVVRKLDGVGAFIAQLLCLSVMASSDYHFNIYTILLIFTVSTFVGKIVGTIVSMSLLSKDKKN